MYRVWTLVQREHPGSAALASVNIRTTIDREGAGKSVLDQRHLAQLINQDQRQHFEELGYLIVENALPDSLVARLEARIDAIHRHHLEAEYDPYTRRPLTADDVFFYPNFLGRDQLFVNLLDWPKTFPLVWAILGWNIYSYHSHFIITPPRTPEQGPGRMGFHQDSGRVNRDIQTHPRPRLSLKVAYWLSDCSVPGRGNFHVVPGSHLDDDMERPSDGTAPPGAIPICCKPGDAVVFDRRLWHSASPNHSQVTRKGLFYGYGYRWLRSKDDMEIPVELFRHNDPVRRQLLGAGVNANGHFTPTDADVPLKTWLDEQGLPT